MAHALPVDNHDLRSQLDDLLCFLEPYIPLANQNTIDFFLDDLWTRSIPKRIRHEIMSVPEKSRIALGSFPFSSDSDLEIPDFAHIGDDTELIVRWKHSSLKEFLTNARKVYSESVRCGIVSNVDNVYEELECGQLAQERTVGIKHMISPKKIHEIEMMAASCAKVAEGLDVSVIVDLGSGKGYLGTTLAHVFHRNVLGIDCSESNTQGALIRTKKLEKKQTILLKKQSNMEQQSGAATTSRYQASTEYVTTQTDFPGMIETHFPGTSGEKCLLTGLHTCGNLAAYSLRIFVDNNAVCGICNVGCCYEHLTQEGEVTASGDSPSPGFPMSEFLKRRGVSLVKQVRSLASQPLARIAGGTLRPSKTLFWRAVLQLILTDRTGGMSRDTWMVGKAGNKCTEFVTYCRKALDKLNKEDLSHTLSDEALLAYESRYKDREDTIYAYYQLRIVLAPLIEALILLDRLLFLREQDYAENTMNELLGLYGYGKVERSDSNQIQHGGQSDDERDNETSDEKCSAASRSPDDKATFRQNDEESTLIPNDGKKPTDCHWCQKTTEKYYSLKTPTGPKIFCSEVCFQQCRRASFKKSKVCDWCKHTRHTVNYVDFQDGDHQVQFCSDKCLNQYKMNIFCRETQEHLKIIKNDGEDDSRSRHSSAEILITPDLWMKPDMTTSPSPEVKRERGSSSTPDERASILDWEMKMRQRSQRKLPNPKQISHSPVSSGSHLESPAVSAGTPEPDVSRMRRPEMDKRIPISSEPPNQQILPHLTMPPLHYPHYSLPLLPPPPPFIPPGMPMMPHQSGLLPFPVFVPVPFPLPIPVPILPKGVTAEDVKEFVKIMKKDDATPKEDARIKVQLPNGHHSNHVTVKLREPERPRDHHDRKCPKRGIDCINCASCQVANRRYDRIPPKRPKDVAKYHHIASINNNNDNHKTLNIVSNDYNEAIDLSKSKKPKVENNAVRDSSSAPLPKINIVPSRPPLSLPPLSATPAPSIDVPNNPHSSRRALLLDSPNAPIGKKRSPSPETQRTRSLIDYKKRCLRARIKSK